MEAVIRNTPEGLTIVLPPTLARQSGLKDGSRVELSVQDGSVVLKPARRRYTLDELLADATPEKLHPLWDTGPAVGEEEW